MSGLLGRGRDRRRAYAAHRLQPELVQRAADAIAAIGVPATLTLGRMTQASALRAPAGLEIVDWGDHDALLAGCASVVTHGGLGTTLRALAHGVPLVAVPLGRDQAFNAARVEQLGAGISLDATADAGTIARAVRRVLAEPGYADAARALAARIAADAPDATAAAALARAAGC
jgi:UDP:flavonoid glycosyltransferase YjiC (YdhE family)